MAEERVYAETHESGTLLRLVLDRPTGNVLTSSLMEYAVPRADFFPPFELDRTVTLTDVNPLGVKGAGETGTIASTPAVVNAVVDALAPLGIKHIDMPLTPERVWRAMRKAGE